jgi:hypothetical protein
VKGGFFLMKKPLECVLSVYSNSETAEDAGLEAVGMLAQIHKTDAALEGGPVAKE